MFGSSPTTIGSHHTLPDESGPAVNELLPDVIICSDGFTFALPASFLKQLDVVRVPLVVSYIGGDILDCPHAEVGRSRQGLTGRLIERSYRGIDVLRPVSPMLADVLMGDGVAGAILSRANELKGLEYSRELETEADNQGFRK